ncbi:MAG: cytochrome b N-terminal domain-containing protein [Candidatus Rokubacteria bacterium]|nr:cytochrome b N-terminal domain-containing protein [Candidatus Rokubacteria bacterium]
MVRLVRSAGRWLEERAGLGAAVTPTLDHPVPRSSASWWYVFGSATLALFVLQIATGICLALVYVPAADQAYESLLYLNYEAPFGWYLRAMHFWGSNAMVAVMTLHMIQVFLWGAYKYPRELTWIVGVLLFLCTLGMAFTGQILRWDQDAYWGLGIAASIAARSPGIGDAVVHVLLGGPIIAGRTLSRFFAIHVFVVPGLLIALIGLHLWLVLRLGINEWPLPGRVVDRETYRKRYEEEVHRDGVPFFPYAARKDMVAMGVVILLVMVCAALFGPFGPNGIPDPTIIDAAPKPDFYFLALFALFALLPPWTETVLMLAGPPLAIGLLLLLPFIAGTGEKSWKRRPVAVLSVILIVLIVTTLAGLGVVVPWSPVMDAWSELPTPIEYVKGRTPLELQGALVLQNKQCRNCHALDGAGGRRGPALDGVATRQTRDQLVRQVLQGRGNMPAYGKNLTPAEVNALVAFLETLRPPGEPPARPPVAPRAASR